MALSQIIQTGRLNHKGLTAKGEIGLATIHIDIHSDRLLTIYYRLSTEVNRKGRKELTTKSAKVNTKERKGKGMGWPTIHRDIHKDRL